MKFLHTADWQIGRVYGFEGESDDHDPAAAMAQARYDAVVRIAGLATSEQVDAVLVAGDVFDKQALSDHSLRRLINAMAGYSGRWILLPGNHDAALAESVWSRLQRLAVLPANIELTLETRVMEYADAGFAILPAPLTQRQTHDDLTEWFDTAETTEGLIRIGLAHGSVAGILAEEIDSPNPIGADRAAQARLDYLALGDWHGTRQIDARTWYSGTPEQDRFKDNDPGNVLLVEIDAPGALPRVTPKRVGRFRWRAQGVEINGSSDVEQLREQLQGLNDTDVVRLHVQGLVDFASSEQLRMLCEEARARAHVFESDLGELRLEPTAADLAAMQVDGALAEVVDELRDMQEQGDQAAVANEALKLLFDLIRREGAGA
ncbi:MAG TPA: DNA repair exonuclease [Dokdonella sp.]|uniref:metallophosphoesterase family protein n=1 Tax=Dokdonella sp. TaxID=2291710 RepID=UPI002D7EB04F|nr:DNA repair exonuclease [Dokdonella sp.]HET9033320.1 DNA repair exonuclease [Dokdonella sp.]